MHRDSTFVLDILRLQAFDLFLLAGKDGRILESLGSVGPGSSLQLGDLVTHCS